MGSDYLALVPLSDPRLERTWSPAFLWSLGFLVACVLGLAAFLVMPRAVQIRQGDFKWGTEMIQWNQTAGTYNLTLSVDIPLQNDNFFPVQLDGDLDVFLFDQMAGNATILPQMIPSTRGTGSKKSLVAHRHRRQPAGRGVCTERDQPLLPLPSPSNYIPGPGGVHHALSRLSRGCHPS